MIMLNRKEKRNALSIMLRDSATAALRELRSDPDIRVVILTGAGETFSGGFDLKEFETARSSEAFREQLWLSSDVYHAALQSFPLPLIAAVNGPAYGGGCDTATLCDLRIAATTAVFGHPEASWGVVAYGPLHDAVGSAIARELCFTGRIISAEEAKQINFVSQVVQPADLIPTTLATAAQIARAPREVLMRDKAKMIRRGGVTFSGTLDL